MIGAFAAATLKPVIAATSTVVATETWTGTTGAAWPGQWTSRVGTNTIQSNTGRLLPAAGAFNIARQDLTGMTAIGGTDLTTTFTPTLSDGSSIAFVIDGDATGTGQFPPNCYGLMVVLNNTGSSYRLYKYVSGTGTQMVTAASGKTITAGATYKARIQRSGTTVRARVWAAASAEPATWDLSGTESGTPLTGKVSIASSNGSATANGIIFDDLTVSSLA